MLKNSITTIVWSVLAVGVLHAGEYKLVVKTAVIEDTKSNGAAWDAFNGAPDPYVIAYNLIGKKYKSKYQTSTDSDTYRPDWNEAAFDVDIGDEIALQVWDKDLMSDDPIGEYRFGVTKKMVADGESRARFDQVANLRFAIKRK